MYPLIPGFFDRTTAALLARGAAAVYGDHDGMAAWAGEQQWSCAAAESSRTDTFGLVALPKEQNQSRDASATLVVFRGTRDLRNWLTDLDCAKTAYWIHGRETRIHRGFWHAWQSVREEVAAIVQQRRVTLAGHSLGGALAMLAGIDLVQSGVEVAGVYTFGQPRVGNAAFMRQYNSALGSRSFRIVAPGDIIPCVPYLLGAYRHAGREMFIDRGLRTADCGSKGARCAEGVRLGEKLIRETEANWHALRHHRFTPLAAHSIVNYTTLVSQRVAHVPFNPQSAFRNPQST
jgi:hypothetical protein